MLDKPCTPSKEAALRAGVGVPLLRAWERRYGISNRPAPHPGTACTTAEDVIGAFAQAEPGLLVAVGGTGADGATLPPSVLRLSDGVGDAARSLEETLSRPGQALAT